MTHKVKSQGKLKDKKKALSKAINSLHDLIFKSHGNCTGIRKLQRRKKITRNKKRDQATIQEQAGQKAGVILTFLPFTKKTSSSPVSFGAMLHAFQNSLKEGTDHPQITHRSQPNAPQQSEHQQYDK